MRVAKTGRMLVLLVKLKVKLASSYFRSGIFLCGIHTLKYGGLIMGIGTVRVSFFTKNCTGYQI